MKQNSKFDRGQASGAKRKQWSKSLQITSVGDSLDGSHENTKLALRAWCLHRFTYNNFHLRQDSRQRWLAAETSRLRADIAAHGGLRNDHAEKVTDSNTNPMLHGQSSPHQERRTPLRTPSNGSWLQSAAHSRGYFLCPESHATCENVWPGMCGVTELPAS